MSKKIRFIGIQEAADITGLSVTTLYRGVQEGRFPVVRTATDAGKILFDEQMLLETLRSEALDSVKSRETKSYLARLFKKEEDEEINQSASFTIK